MSLRYVAATPGLVNGRVTLDEAGVPYATVILAPASDSKKSGNYFTTTDDCGTFVFPREVAEGEYRVLVRGVVSGDNFVQQGLDHVQREVRLLSTTRRLYSKSGKDAKTSARIVPEKYGNVFSSPLKLKVDHEVGYALELELHSEQLASLNRTTK